MWHHLNKGHFGEGNSELWNFIGSCSLSSSFVWNMYIYIYYTNTRIHTHTCTSTDYRVYMYIYIYGTCRRWFSKWTCWRLVSFFQAVGWLENSNSVWMSVFPLELHEETSKIPQNPGVLTCTSPVGQTLALLTVAHWVFLTNSRRLSGRQEHHLNGSNCVTTGLHEFFLWISCVFHSVGFFF